MSSRSLAPQVEPMLDEATPPAPPRPHAPTANERARAFGHVGRFDAPANDIADVVLRIESAHSRLVTCVECYVTRPFESAWMRVEWSVADRPETKILRALCDRCVERAFPAPVASPPRAENEQATSPRPIFVPGRFSS